MTKLLRVLGLTTILSASVLTLTKTNNNHISTIQNINSNKVVINNINKKMSVTAKPGYASADEYESKLVLDLPWKEAQTITSGIVSNYFKYSLGKNVKINNELHLKLLTTKEQTTNSIILAGLNAESDIDNKYQISDIFISIYLYQVKNNPNLTKAKFKIVVDVQNNNELNEKCSTFCFIDKITLNK